jgi:tetratricopeptide (TPR) repeat protein
MHNVIVFYGQRRIGKTSILHQIAQRQNQAYRPVFFDFQSNIDSAAPHLFYDLARTITHELELPPPDPARFQNDPHAFQTTFLPMIHQVLGQERLLLLLDEFDAISLDPNTAELDTSPFVRALNRIIQGDDKRVIFLFVVGRRLKDLASQQLQIFRGARDRQIGLLKQEDARQLIIRPAEELLTYHEAAIERVWALTSGQPYFIQSLCHELFNRAKRAGTWTVTATDVDAVIDEAISASQSALRWFWDEVPPIERFTLYTIGQLTTETQGVTRDQLVAQRDAQQVRVPDFELRDLPDKLVDRQVLRRVSPERYQFAVEMVRRWIIQSHSLEEVTTELTRAAISDLAKALFKTGQAAFRAGDSHLALDNFSRAISIDANYVEARLWLARAYLATGDLLAAINEFVNVERFGGLEQGEARLGLADARAKYGRQLEEKGQLDEAKQEYERVLELDPKHPAANMHLGEMVRQGGDQQLDDQGVEAARPFYEQAARYNPELKYDITERLNSYSQTQVEAKNWQEAEQASRLADKLMSTTGSQEALLDVQLRWGRWQLEHHHLEAATELYRRLLRESDNETSRQVIKNDILRYSREQEEQHQWGRAETVLALLVEWFPDDPEHASRLQDHLCRQAEYYLGQGEFAKAEVTYRRILANALSDQTLRGMIKAGFQAYQRTRLADEHLETRQQVVQAMTLLIEILDERDPTAYQWRAEARKALGDGLRKAKKRTEAKAVYQQAQEDLNRATELTIESDPVQYPYKPEIQFSLGLLALDEAKFDAATAHFKQALAEIDDPAAMAGRTKTALNAYRQQQEQQHQWPQAHRAIEMLADLFPDDDQIRLWQAELNVALAGWHLQRAIPDLDEAQRLAYTALDTVSSAQKETIAAKIKDVFKTRSDHQEQTTPPAWEQAEQMLNRLVSLIPDDPLVHRWLGESRMRQGDWYLSQAEPVVLQAEEYLTSATQVYRRALNDASGDLYLITHLKKSFRDYHQRYRTSTSPLAVQAMLMLAELLPHDEEVQRWTYEKPAPASWLERVRQQPALSAAIAGGVFLLCAGVLFLWPNGSFGGLIAAISPQTPTPTVTPTAPPSPTATLAQPNTPVFTTSTDTATLSPTETPTSTPLPTATLLPTHPNPKPTEKPTKNPTHPQNPPLIPTPTPLKGAQKYINQKRGGFCRAT